MNVIFEDNHIIAVNKNCSEIVQGDKTGDISLDIKVKEYLKKKYNKPGNVFLGVTHRIDRPVSGVVLFARTGKALTRLNKLFSNKEIKKTYWAIVKKFPQKKYAKLQNYISRNTEKNKSFAHQKEVNNSKLAIMSYKTITESDNYSLLEIDLETGRHHQIRCQLSAIDMPIKGDLKYGYPRSNRNGGISLHARRIEFIHPVNKNNIIIEANPPADDKLWKTFQEMM
jgi:23S rRNA pseudouridine1911/1915/1917 synthase